MLVNHKNLNYRHKVFKVAHEIRYERRIGKVIIYASKSWRSLSSARSLPSSARNPRLYTIHMDYLFSFILFSPMEIKEGT